MKKNKMEEKIQIHIFLTKELNESLPETATIIHRIPCDIFTFLESENGDPTGSLSGFNSVVEDTQENIINWLKQYDGVYIGVGPMQMEQFEIMHIKDELL